MSLEWHIGRWHLAPKLDLVFVRVPPGLEMGVGEMALTLLRLAPMMLLTFNKQFITCRVILVVYPQLPFSSLPSFLFSLSSPLPISPLTGGP